MLQVAVIASMAPLVLAALKLHEVGQLDAGVEGRSSAGPVDVAAFLQCPKVQVCHSL